MTSLRMLPAMDINRPNDEHETQYYISKQHYPSDESNDQFELFYCPYDSNHKITSKRWTIHLANCRKLFGGGNTRACVFNASHHIPIPEWDWHMKSCPDKDIIRQDIEGSNSGWKMVTSKVESSPCIDGLETGENWEDEIDKDAEEFNLDVRKGTAMTLLPQNNDEEYEEDNHFYNHNDDDDRYSSDDDGTTMNHALTSVRHEELLPEKPANWSDMTKNQKKNYKRRYDRQQQRLGDAGLTVEDFKPETDPNKWSLEQRDAKLKAIMAAFPMGPNRINVEKVDYTSLLNIVCQKIRLNLPIYSECAPGPRGGFAYRCQVRDQFYQGSEYSSTKKDAKHVCAKWALLSMDIPGLDSVVGSKRQKPVHPRTAEQTAALKEGNELGRLIMDGSAVFKKDLPLGQPKQKSRSVENDGRLSQPQTSYTQEKNQSAANSRLALRNQRLAGEEKQVVREQHRPQQQHQQQQQQQQQQHHQQNSSSKPCWGGWGGSQETTQRITQQQQRLPHHCSAPPGFSTMAAGVGNIKISNDEQFPSLGGGSVSSSVSRQSKGRGRGRGTTMKP